MSIKLECTGFFPTKPLRSVTWRSTLHSNPAHGAVLWFQSRDDPDFWFTVHSGHPAFRGFVESVSGDDPVELMKCTIEIKHVDSATPLASEPVLDLGKRTICICEPDFWVLAYRCDP